MASSRDVAKALNMIGADFLSSSDKKALDDLIYEYFDPRSNDDSDDSDDSDEFEDFFQTEAHKTSPADKNKLTDNSNYLAWEHTTPPTYENLLEESSDSLASAHVNSTVGQQVEENSHFIITENTTSTSGQQLGETNRSLTSGCVTSQIGEHLLEEDTHYPTSAHTTTPPGQHLVVGDNSHYPTSAHTTTPAEQHLVGDNSHYPTSAHTAGQHNEVLIGGSESDGHPVLEIGGEVLIGGSESDDSDDENEPIIPSTVALDVRTIDVNEELKIQEFAKNGCTCQQGEKQQPCCTSITSDEYKSYRMSIFELTKKELDLVVIGQIAAMTNFSDVKVNHHFSQTRKHQHSTFLHGGRRVCLKTFLFLHDISIKKYKALKRHYHENGIATRQHGNEGRLPANTMTRDDINNLLRFLDNYSEENAILLPGRIPGYKRDDCKLLPSSNTKKMIWMKYKDSIEQYGGRCAAYTTFCCYWRKLRPTLCITKPMADLCAICHKNSSLITSSFRFGTPESEKTEVLKKAKEHLELVKTERDYYRLVTKEAHRISVEHFSINNKYSPPQPGLYSQPQSGPSLAHYSFDFAQQVHFPCDPWQPGPLYFKTPRKCGIFGVHCESIPMQMNYLIDESAVTGKGANEVISMLHHFFETHGLGEAHCHLHADNCVGQNKNNTVIQYLLWRVLVGLHSCITLSFLPVGHTKFSPDWCFGLLKQKYRRTIVGCLNDIHHLVEQSAEVNQAQLVVTQDGEMIVKMYDWSNFLNPHFKKIPGIKKFKHFHINTDKPGKIAVKTSSFSTVHTFNALITPWTPSQDSLPLIIIPKGLNSKRQWYLYDHIREHCPNEFCKNAVCPHPTVPRPPESTSNKTMPLSPITNAEPPSKRCRICQETGHNSRSCNNK